MKIFMELRPPRFVASLLASLMLGHITADKRYRYAWPKSPSATSFIRGTLGNIAGGEIKCYIRIGSGWKIFKNLWELKL